MNNQIEEMAQNIYEQKSCDTSFKENCKTLAYDLVTLGYQKIDKDKQVVLSREEYEVLKVKEKEKHWLQTCMSIWENGKIDGSKETAEKILNELLDFVNGWFEGVENNDFGVEFNRISKDFAEKYGVKIKE